MLSSRLTARSVTSPSCPRQVCRSSPVCVLHTYITTNGLTCESVRIVELVHDKAAFGVHCLPMSRVHQPTEAAEILLEEQCQGTDPALVQLWSAAEITSIVVLQVIL